MQEENEMKNFSYIYKIMGQVEINQEIKYSYIKVT